jgi:hypothetical protein
VHLPLEHSLFFHLCLSVLQSLSEKLGYLAFSIFHMTSVNEMAEMLKYKERNHQSKLLQIICQILFAVYQKKNRSSSS